MSTRILISWPLIWWVDRACCGILFLTIKFTVLYRWTWWTLLNIHFMPSWAHSAHVLKTVILSCLSLVKILELQKRWPWNPHLHEPIVNWQSLLFWYARYTNSNGVVISYYWRAIVTEYEYFIWIIPALKVDVRMVFPKTLKPGTIVLW